MTDPVRDSFPKVSVQRGGMNWFPKPGTPEWDRAQRDREQAELIQRMVARHVGDVIKAQNSVVDRACWEALVTDCDVHVHRHPYKPTRFIGIELVPREPGRIFPTIREHTDDYQWDDWDA